LVVGAFDSIVGAFASVVGAFDPNRGTCSLQFEREDS
jgi:hypothetical protein